MQHGSFDSHADWLDRADLPDFFVKPDRTSAVGTAFQIDQSTKYLKECCRHAISDRKPTTKYP
jgi:hypothetical protein